MSDSTMRVRWDLLQERFVRHVFDGDDVAAQRQVMRLHNRRVPIRDIITRLFVPAAQELGDGWAVGRISVAEEHRATEMLDRLLGQLSPRVPGKRRGTAVVATVDGDRHTLPTTMAAAALREDRWRVEHLGSDVPRRDTVAFVEGVGPEVVVLSVSIDEVARETEELSRELEAKGFPTLVGGPGRTLDELCERAVAHSRAAPEPAVRERIATRRARRR